MNYNRNAYDSASAWVTAVKNEDFWKRQLKRLEKNSSKEFPQLYNDALDQLKRGSWDYMWKTYKPDGEKMAEKIWEGGEVTVPQMENLTVALLTLEWLEKQKGGSHDVKTEEPSPKVVEQLKPIFYGNEEEARDFLKRIKNMKPPQITDLVKQLVSEKKISDMSCRRDLWTVLSNNGYYNRSEANWNQQLKKSPGK